MKWRTTWMLVGTAAVLFAFIVLVERRLRPTYAEGAPPARLFSFKAAEVTNIILRVTNQLSLRADRDPAGNSWSLTLPIVYPAQTPAIEWLIQAIEGLAPTTYITPQELVSGRQSLADFGLDVPGTTIALVHGGKRSELAFGSKTTLGDEVYMQLPDRPGVFLVPAELSDRLPRNFNDWRDSMLFNSGRFEFTRLEVRAPGRGFVL
jgi:hypothetical protein